MKLFSKQPNGLKKILTCLFLALCKPVLAQNELNTTIELSGFGLKLGAKVEDIKTGEKDEYLEEIWDYKPPKPLDELTFYDLEIFEQQYITTINGGGMSKSLKACRQRRTELAKEYFARHPKAKFLTKEELTAWRLSDETTFLQLSTRSYIKLDCELTKKSTMLNVSFHLSPSDFLPRIPRAFGIDFSTQLKNINKQLNKGEKYILYPAPEAKYGFTQPLTLLVSPKTGKPKLIQAVKEFNTYEMCKKEMANVIRSIEIDYGITLKHEGAFDTYKFNNSSECVILDCTKTKTEKSQMFLDFMSKEH